MTFTETVAGFASKLFKWNDNPPPNGYDQDATWMGYRSDCSGWYGFLVNGPGGLYCPNSSDLINNWVDPIDHTDMDMGDVVIATANNEHAFGHVVPVVGKYDPNTGTYPAVDFGFGSAPLHHNIPWPYFSYDSRTFRAYRYRNLDRGTVTPPPTPNHPTLPTGVFEVLDPNDPIVKKLLANDQVQTDFLNRLNNDFTGPAGQGQKNAQGTLASIHDRLGNIEKKLGVVED